MYSDLSQILVTSHALEKAYLLYDNKKRLAFQIKSLMHSYGMFIRQNLDQINHTYFNKELRNTID